MFNFAPSPSFGDAAGAAKGKQVIQNGDFATGGFDDWTLFTTPDGTLGDPPDPQVTSFDVTGHGAQNAAEFQVGQAVGAAGEEGGGIEQTVVTKAGALDFSADVAVYSSLMKNSEGGVFSVLLDGVVEDTVSFGKVALGHVKRATLTFDADVSAGSHEIEILITRQFTDGTGRGETPFQYVTNISAKLAKTDLRGTVASAHLFAAAAAAMLGPAAAAHAGAITAGFGEHAAPVLSRPMTFAA